MIPRFKPVVGWKELVAAFTPPGSDDVSGFERAFASEMGQLAAISYPYGRTALSELLSALGIRGRQIICPAYTCVVVAHAIVTSGNRPRFIDSGSDANMDLDLAEEAIDENTGAMIVTSIFGHPVDLDRLDILRERYPRLVIIQDCAHSFSAEWRGRPVQKEGVAAIYGLNISKMITSIYGGIITTDNQDLARRLRQARDVNLTEAGLTKSLRRMIFLLSTVIGFSRSGYSLVNRLETSGLLNSVARYYDEATIEMPDDYLVKMAPCEGRVGMAQLKRYQGMIAARRKYADYYQDELGDLQGIEFIPCEKGATYSQISARVADKAHVMTEAGLRGVQLGEVLEYCIPDMPAYEKIASRDGPWPVARRLSRQVINLPVSGEYSEIVAEEVVKVMRSVLEGAAYPEES